MAPTGNFTGGQLYLPKEDIVIDFEPGDSTAKPSLDLIMTTRCTSWRAPLVSVRSTQRASRNLGVQRLTSCAAITPLHIRR